MSNPGDPTQANPQTAGGDPTAWGGGQPPQGETYPNVEVPAQPGAGEPPPGMGGPGGPPPGGGGEGGWEEDEEPPWYQNVTVIVIGVLIVVVFLAINAGA